MNISINIVVRNEEKRLNVLLPLLTKQGFDDIVVVDQESTDNTFELCQSFGCNVIKDIATGYAESSRQLALCSSKYEWVLMLDADEYIVTRFVDDMQWIVKENIDGVMCSLAQFRYVDYGLETILGFGEEINIPHVSIPYRYRLGKKNSFWIVDRLHGGVGPHHKTRILYLHYNGIVEIKNREEEIIDMRRYESIEKGCYSKDFV